MKCTAEILVENGKHILEAFQPEEKQMKRSEFSVERTKNGIKFLVKAKDAVAFRATLANITQLLATHEKTVKIDDS